MEKGNSALGVIGVIIALVVVIGGALWFMNMNDEDTAENETTTDTSQTEQQAEQPAVQESPDIVALAAGTDSLSTLVSAVQAAELVETLQSEGPFTVFAPNNAAFDALPDGTLDTLLQPDNQDQLAAILTYHVVSGEVMSTDLSDGQEIETVQGETLTVSIRDGMVYLVDATGGESQVVAADVEASNGVVHIVDAVLLFE